MRAYVYLAAALTVFGGWWWMDRQNDGLRSANKALAEANKTLTEANQSNVRTIASLQASYATAMDLARDNNRIIERHYVTERQVIEAASEIQQERHDANLEDGSVSPDLAFVLDRLRQDYLARHPDGGSGAVAAD